MRSILYSWGRMVGRCGGGIVVDGRDVVPVWISVSTFAARSVVLPSPEWTSTSFLSLCVCSSCSCLLVCLAYIVPILIALISKRTTLSKQDQEDVRSHSSDW